MSSAPAPAPPAPPSVRGPRAAWRGLCAAWSGLDHRQHRVAAAVAVVFVTLLLPWYAEDSLVRRGPGSIVRSGDSLSALAGMSFIEAGVIVVLLAILALLWGRGRRRRFALPFDDGTLVCAGSAWIGALIVYRLFARPRGVDSATEQTLVGLNWGIFASLVAVGLLFLAGLDLRRHGPRYAVPGEPAPVPPDRGPDVSPETVVVRPAATDRPPDVEPSAAPPATTAVAPRRPRPSRPDAGAGITPRRDPRPDREWPSQMRPRRPVPPPSAADADPAPADPPDQGRIWRDSP